MAIPIEIVIVVPAAVKIAFAVHSNQPGASIARAMTFRVVPTAYIATA